MAVEVIKFIFERIMTKKNKNTKHVFLTVSAIFLLFSLSKPTQAENNVSKSNTVNQQSSEYIQSVYGKINFCQSAKLNPQVFEHAYRGFINLKSSGKLNSTQDIITICDYTLSSNVKRMWIVDLNSNKVLLNTYVAHGQGTGDEFATEFSNKENSHQSSMGFYVTGDTYQGEHGLSLHLHGMDQNYNNAAYQRAIVLHGAHYVSESFIQQHKRLGRSWGCPAVANELAPEIINLIKDGTCLFSFHDDKQYLSSSLWLNRNASKFKNRFELAQPQQPDATELNPLIVQD